MGLLYAKVYITISMPIQQVWGSVNLKVFQVILSHFDALVS